MGCSMYAAAHRAVCHPAHESQAHPACIAGDGACCQQSPYGNAYCNGACCAGQCVASNVTGQNFTCMPGDVVPPGTRPAPGPQISH